MTITVSGRGEIWYTVHDSSGYIVIRTTDRKIALVAEKNNKKNKG
jgi:hypothetical protein